MERGKSNSSKITQCCLLCDLFPVDGSIYLGDKENTEACEVDLLDRCELTETFSSSFFSFPAFTVSLLFLQSDPYIFL